MEMTGEDFDAIWSEIREIEMSLGDLVRILEALNDKLIEEEGDD